MPYLQFESVGGLPTTSNKLYLLPVNDCPEQGTDCLLQVKNIGHGTATAIKYTCVNFTECHSFPVTALQNGDAQSFNAWFPFSINEVFAKAKKVILRLFYCDLLHNHYEQEIELTFTYDHLKNKVQLTCIDVQSPRFIKESSNV